MAVRAPGKVARIVGVWTRILAFALCVSATGRAGAQQVATNVPVVRFGAVDIFVDSKGKPLAAYQLEFSAADNSAKIVGIEGGEHPAFAEPPYYDPKAMQEERVVIAAFSTNAPAMLPTGKTRVATIHLQITGTNEPMYQVKLHVAADENGDKIDADAIAAGRTKP